MNRPQFDKKLQILIVDDEPEALQIMRRHFELEGYNLVTAEDGWDGVKKARALQPNVVLLDVMLPELDGFAVCELLRRNESTAAIPILMVSGLGGQMPRCAAIEAGATDFVTKPVTPSNLSRKVKQLLGRKIAEISDASSATSHAVHR